ncbi:MAG TPA: YkgJ family cysteine cluster protein [Geothermobacteraceae bacterium]|nr:YkgJ family cysteine cluster protein [Geothermobacteraceae bacterium]
MTRFDLNDFAARLQQTARTLLQNTAADQHLGEVARAVQELTEVALARHQINPEQIACQAGCGHCCIVNVAVLVPEVDAIIAHLRHKKSPAQLQQLAERAEEMFHQVSGLDDEERILSRIHCLFLDATGRCDIYPVRPLLCRALTSTDAGRCREAITMLAMGAEVQILANTFQQDLFTRAFTGLGAALDNARLESRSRTLTSAIRERRTELS